MEATKLDGCLSNLLLALLTSLQCSDNNLGGGDVSRHVLYESGVKDDLVSVVFSRKLSCIPIVVLVSPWCSGYHYCTTSFN